MAKGKSHKKRDQRDTNVIATRPRVLASPPSPPIPPVHVTPADRTVLRPTPRPVQDDRRTFHPLGEHRPVKTVSGRNAALGIRDKNRKIRKMYYQGKTLVMAPKKVASQTKAALSYVDGSRVAICIRRKTRRQVLAALRKFGKGAGSRRHHTPFSRIGC